MQSGNSLHSDGEKLQDTQKKGLARFSTEPVWVAGIFTGLLVLSLTAGLMISGFLGILIAVFPLAVLLLILALLNPYPFWLMYFALVPFMLIFKDYFPTGSFTRFMGLFMVALSIPHLLLAKKTFKFRITSLGASLLFFLAGCALSLLSFFNLGGSLVGLGLFVGNVLAYWVFINIFSSRKRLLSVINVLIAVLTVEAVIGIVQKFTGPALVRSQGTITDPNYFGLWLLPFICISFYLGVGAQKWWVKLLYFSAYALMTVAIPLTYSRSMILVLLPIQFILFWRQKKLLLFILLAAVMAFILYLGFIQLFEGNFSIGSFFTAARAASIGWRFYFAKTAVRIFFDHPLIGVGADNFKYIFRFYSEITPRIAYEVIHNSYLEILSGMGLLGFLPFMAIIFFVMRNFWKARKKYVNNNNRTNALFTEGLLIGFVAFLLGHLFLSAQHHIVLWFLIAASSIVFKLSGKNQAEEKIPTSEANQGLPGKRGA